MSLSATTGLLTVARQARQRLFGADLPADFSDADAALVRAVRPYTMTSPERVVALSRAVEYIADRNVPGAIVECGVWRGGSMLAVARTLLSRGVTDRELYLFDTFDGMASPTEEDVAITGESAASALEASPDDDGVRARASLELVRSVLFSSGYRQDRFHLVQGMVEQTIPESAPQTIALLRLDTDWYASTRHELLHLYPRLVRGGVLIIDDYGHWQGARKAVDDYFEETGEPPLLNRIDYTGRIAVKC